MIDSEIEIEKILSVRGERLSSILELQAIYSFPFVKQTIADCESYKKYVEVKLYDLVKKNVHFVITGSEDLNAFACSVDKENDLVGINAGTIFYFWGCPR